MAVDYNAGQFWFTAIQLGITASGWVYAIWTSRTKVTNARFVALEEKIGEVEKDLGEKISAADTKASNPVCANHIRMEKNDVELFQNLRNMHGDIRGLSEGVKALTNSMALVTEHLINGGR